MSAQWLELHPVNPQQRLLNQAAVRLREGAVIAYPTDSCYALGCHLDDKNAAGVFAGIAIPLGPSLSSFAGLTHDKNGTSATADLQKSIGTEPGSYGGRLSIAEGANPFVSGYGAVKLQGGVLEGSLTQHGSAVDGYAAFSGALVAAGKGLFFAQRIDDAFVVVDAFQGQGIGALLTQHLAGLARAAGLKELVAEVLPGNMAMRRVLGKFGFRTARSLDPQVIHLTLPLV